MMTRNIPLELSAGWKRTIRPDAQGLVSFEKAFADCDSIPYWVGPIEKYQLLKTASRRVQATVGRHSFTTTLVIQQEGSSSSAHRGS